VAAHLRRADVLLHSSLSEGLPNVVLEAMACALPVVATDVGGTREAVCDGVEGFLVPPRDARAAAAALRALWGDPELRGRMGRAGRARVEADFTIDRATDDWVELYERVARGG
jgi:glycosyltransferase involved in cell wall biosynthesis